jgi:hypothetical protein
MPRCCSLICGVKVHMKMGLGDAKRMQDARFEIVQGPDRGVAQR